MILYLVRLTDLLIITKLVNNNNHHQMLPILIVNQFLLSVMMSALLHKLIAMLLLVQGSPVLPHLIIILGYFLGNSYLIRTNILVNKTIAMVINKCSTPQVIATLLKVNNRF